MRKNIKTDGVITWVDNLETSEETDEKCMHSELECGVCNDCGESFEGIYADLYDRE